MYEKPYNIANLTIRITYLLTIVGRIKGIIGRYRGEDIIFIQKQRNKRFYFRRLQK